MNQWVAEAQTRSYMPLKNTSSVLWNEIVIGNLFESNLTFKFSYNVYTLASDSRLFRIQADKIKVEFEISSIDETLEDGFISLNRIEKLSMKNFKIIEIEIESWLSTEHLHPKKMKQIHVSINEQNNRIILDSQTVIFIKFSNIISTEISLISIIYQNSVNQMKNDLDIEPNTKILEFAGKAINLKLLYVFYIKITWII